MTDTTASLTFKPSFSSEEWRRKFIPAFTTKNVSRASRSMLDLRWSNLEVRLRIIDETALQTEAKSAPIKAVADLIWEGNSEVGAAALDWDDVCKAERMIGLLLSGPRYAPRSECATAGADQPTCALWGDKMRREYELLLKPASDAPAADDATLRAFLLRVLETIQWQREEKVPRPTDPHGRDQTCAVLRAGGVSVHLGALSDRGDHGRPKASARHGRCSRFTVRLRPASSGRASAA